MQKLAQVTKQLDSVRDGVSLFQALKGVYDRLSCQMLTTAGLVITATTGKKVPKTGASVSYGVIKGKPFSVASGLDMPALAGTVANAAFNVYCFFVKTPGAITATSANEIVSAMGTAGASLGAVTLPPIPEGSTMLGFIIVNPTGTGDFVGGTTALDDATVAPGTVYVNCIGAFDPTATL